MSKRFNVTVTVPVLAETAEDAAFVAENLLAQVVSALPATRFVGYGLAGGTVGEVTEVPASESTETPEPVAESATV